MDYKYAGRTFDIELSNNGKIICSELSIEADTVDECKVAIRENTEKEKKLPTVNVIFLSGGKIIHGTAKPKDVGTGRYYRKPEVWVSWKEVHKGRGDNERRKKYVDDIYLDTPENMEILERYIEIRKNIDALLEDADAILKNAKRIEIEES